VRGPRPVRTGFAGLLSFALACGSDASGPDEDANLPTTQFLSFQSDVGDYIGEGQSRMYARHAGQWRAVRHTQPGGSHIVIGFTDEIPDGERLALTLAAPLGQQIGVGTYTGAVRWPFNTVSKPGLEFARNARGCNTIAGEFSITALRMASDTLISHLAATFVQHCEEVTPALRGEVSIAPLP
jgi:hypothetical protein